MMEQKKAAKVYVSVLAAFGADGRLIPRRIRWEDGQIYSVDDVLDVRPAASLKAGGQGTRYTVRIRGQLSYLFFEQSTDGGGVSPGRWFVERRAS